jgi:hypothetical protein
MARPCFSGGLMSNITAWASGTRNAPATPWKARKATISSRFCAAAQSREAIVKAITERTNSRLRPIRSASQPVIGIAIAEATM